MTRTDPPDILVSTVYKDIKVFPVSSHSKSSQPPEQCDSPNRSTLDNNQDNKRHCRTFDYKSLEYPKHHTFSMEHPLTPQPLVSDMASEVVVPVQRKRTRSKSAPRVQTNLTPVSFEESPSMGRRGREARRAPRDPNWRPEVSPRRECSYAATRALMHEVHPIKLQPQRSDASRYSPLYVAEHVEEGGPDKPATSPHVRCRVDIKPDRYPSGGSRSLTVPRHFTFSRTSTPTDSFGGEYGQAYQYSRSMPNSDYYGRERRAHSSPNVPTKLFYADDPGRYVATAPPQPRTYYQDDRYKSYPYPVQAAYPKAYAASEPGPYIIQTPPARTFYGDDLRTYQIQSVPPRIYYANEMYTPSQEHHIPARAYYTEGRRHARVVQPQPDDWYGSEVSGYSTHHPASYGSQVTPTRAVRQEPALTPWYANPCIEPPRIGTDSKPYSRSWDNILNSRVEREQPIPVQRGRSYENLIAQAKRTAAEDDRPQPVVVNLSSSPRRYAALSLSDNSLIDKSPTSESGKTTSSKLWFVAPEITITDNDIRPGNLNKFEARRASWDPDTMSCSQLDELLADLVTDYKPPATRRPSEDLLDQLKKLIDEEEAASLSRKGSKAGSEEPPLDKQPTSIRMNPDALRDMDCSNQSPDEDDSMMCSNNKCRRTETLFNACLYFKSCHSCYTYYCSRNCRREDWDIHKESCLYGRIGSVCRHIIKHCRETVEVHKAFSRIAKVGFLSRGRGVLFLGFPNPGLSGNFLQYGLESLQMSPTYLSLRELDGFKDNLGEYCKELQEAGKDYDPNECFLLNVSIAVGEQMPDGPSPRNQAPTVRKYAKVALASYSPEKSKVLKKERDMETLILTPPPGMADIDNEGEEGRKAREICFINIQRELRIRGVFLRHEYPKVYQQLCEFVESNRRFTPTTIYPIDKRTGKQFMCMIMAASEPRTLDWVGTPHLLDDII
ncbi:unnamed protein product [Oncorhynchus mykiss]|uniref:Apical junction molecule ajm1 alpha/beta domain-containing protein n=1 Tax=Oncorhynchus mykiss TaxID=8022 RepID=A0A060W615_ONCMY|nr:unnamed protein product [Oncorhynchus mykiss]